ncbi:MAG TPA: hypothetical protein VFG54_12475 [Prolixibacteraceae bacterium]|nr:hypothetical protein [Prolixibacteraceae bacterium]
MGIRINPAIIKIGSKIYMNNPIYVPPKPKNQFKINNEAIAARLKTARTAPEMDIQFFIDEGNFMFFQLE